MRTNERAWKGYIDFQKEIEAKWEAKAQTDKEEGQEVAVWGQLSSAAAPPSRRGTICGRLAPQNAARMIKKRDFRDRYSLELTPPTI